MNKTKQAEASRRHYLKNREALIKRAKEKRVATRKRNQQHLWDYKLENPCVDCGECNPIVLQFDHRDDVEKLISVTEMVNREYSIEKINQEIQKCDVRCANCHLIRTAKQLDWHKNIDKRTPYECLASY